MKSLIFLLLPLSVIAVEKPALQEFAEANNLFTQDVYKQLTKIEENNFLVSPFSAETVLALTQSGCKGGSAEEILNALHLPKDKNKVESFFKTLLPKIKNDSTLHTANKIYVQENFHIQEEFKTTSSSVYSADVENVQFSKNDDAANTINQWVEKQTNNRIKNLINSDDLDQNTKTVLINALYLKADWAQKFITQDTEKKLFYETSTDVKKTDFMHHYGKLFNYYENPDLEAQFLELPFKGNDVFMVIALPKDKDKIADLEKKLDQVFAEHPLQPTYLNVVLPKFTIDTSIDFKKILQNLGVQKVFNGNQADLSGIAGNKGDLEVSKVAQKAYIDVNEGGVEAAAATQVLVTNGTAPIQNPKDFIADHAFIFYIKFKEIILFAGRVADPTKYYHNRSNK